MNPISAVNHITFRVAELERSIKFYVELLGFQLNNVSTTDCYLSSGTVWLCLLQRNISGPPSEQTTGIDHIASTVSNEFFDLLVHQLRKHNVNIIRGPVKRGDGMSINFSDPDGIQIELHTGTLSGRLQHHEPQPR